MENIELIQRVSCELEKLGLLIESYKLEDFTIQEMEKGLFKQLLRLGKELLGDVVQSKIEGLKDFKPKTEEGLPFESKGMKERKYLSIFGLMEFFRLMHWNKEQGSYYELDKRLDFPPKLWSYNLQEWVGERAAEDDFKESVSTFNKVLGLDLSAMGSKRNGEDLGPLVDLYYENKEVTIEESAEHFSLSIDGKGVPKIVDKEKRHLSFCPNSS